MTAAKRTQKFQNDTIKAGGPNWPRLRGSIGLALWVLTLCGCGAVARTERAQLERAPSEGWYTDARDSNVRYADGTPSERASGSFDLDLTQRAFFAAPADPVRAQPTGAQTAAATPAQTMSLAAEVSCEPMGQASKPNRAACADCVARKCQPELKRCEKTPGCTQILMCVERSGCSGRDCYCGTASVFSCLAGNANGPCKNAVLRAPGGRKPTWLRPSAGPASDAAIGIAECADDDDRCGEVCEVE